MMDKGQRIKDKGRFWWQALKLILSRWENLKSVLTCGVRVVGRVHIVIRNAQGLVTCDEVVPNLVVSAGLAHIADQMSDQGEAAMSHMAVGTGAVAAAAGDTALGTELDRNALDSTTQATASVVYVCTWAAGDGTGAITEAGIFNNAAAGTMLCRSVFSVKNKGAGDSMTLTWTVTFS